MKNKSEKYVGMGTKVSPAMADVINAICDSLGVDVYHLLQQFLYTMVRAASSQHSLSPEIDKILTMMDMDAGWQHAFNICNPDGLSVAQCILILEQKDKKGFGAVMVDRPWIGESTQTECFDEILERVLEVTMHGIYDKIRKLGARMECEHLSDLLLRMIDAQTIIELDEENEREMKGPDNIADNGRCYAYGKKTKSKQHRTIDGEDHRQQVISFNESDRQAVIIEAGVTADDIEDGLGCKPFTDEA